MASYMLTTVDNPWNPVTQFDAWHAYDTQAGHHSLSYLARIVKTSDELSESDQELAIDLAIDEIVRENINGLYRKVLVEDDGTMEPVAVPHDSLPTLS